MVTPDQRTRQRSTAWQRLEELIDRARGGIAQLSAAELQELGQLYRQTCTDLAIARRDYPDHLLTSYLNQLVARAHGVVYRYSLNEPHRIITSFRFTLPQTFRATWPMTLVAAILLLLPAIAAFITTFRDPALGEVLIPGIEVLVDQIRAGEEWWLRINDGPAAATAEIMTNNINVAIRAFVGGVTFGLYTAYILVINGLLLGTVSGIAQRLDFAPNLWGFVIGHMTQTQCHLYCRWYRVAIGLGNSAARSAQPASRADCRRPAGCCAAHQLWADTDWGWPCRRVYFTNRITIYC